MRVGGSAWELKINPKRPQKKIKDDIEERKTQRNKKQQPKASKRGPKEFAFRRARDGAAKGRGCWERVRWPDAKSEVTSAKSDLRNEQQREKREESREKREERRQKTDPKRPPEVPK